MRVLYRHVKKEERVALQNKAKRREWVRTRVLPKNLIVLPMLAHNQMFGREMIICLKNKTGPLGSVLLYTKNI